MLASSPYLEIGRSWQLQIFVLAVSCEYKQTCKILSKSESVPSGWRSGLCGLALYQKYWNQCNQFFKFSLRPVSFRNHSLSAERHLAKCRPPAFHEISWSLFLLSSKLFFLQKPASVVGTIKMGGDKLEPRTHRDLHLSLSTRQLEFHFVLLFEDWSDGRKTTSSNNLF